MIFRTTFLFIFIWILGITIAESDGQVLRKKVRSLAEGKRAMQLFREGKYDESAKLFEKILADNPRSFKTKEMLAIIGFKKKDTKMSETYARLVLKQNNRSATGHFVMAYVYKVKSKRLAALDHLRKAQKYAKTENEKEFLKSNVFEIEQPQVTDVIESNVESKPSEDSLPLIAVFRFDESGADSTESQLGMTVAEMLITSLVSTERYKVFERNQLDKILEEQALGMSGALDTETAVDVGKILGVDAIVTGSCSRIAGQIELDARIIHATTAEVKIAAAAAAKQESDLRQAVNTIAQELAKGAGKLEN